AALKIAALVRNCRLEGMARLTLYHSHGDKFILPRANSNFFRAGGPPPHSAARISLPNHKTVLPFLHRNLGCGPASAATATFLHFKQIAFPDEAIAYEPFGDSPSSHAVNV